MVSKKRKNLYEGMYIISATLSEEARARALDRITAGIVEKGGELKKVHDMGRKKFAYSVEGRREGYYYLIFFEAQTDLIKELWSDYLLNEDLIRFMHLRTEEVPESIEFQPLVQA